MISRLQFEVCILDPWFQARVAPQSSAHLKRTSRLAVSARLCATASTCTGTAQVSAGTRGLPRNRRACMPPSSHHPLRHRRAVQIATYRVPDSLPPTPSRPGLRQRRAYTNPSPLASSLAHSHTPSTNRDGGQRAQPARTGPRAWGRCAVCSRSLGTRA